jgi:hypothetical protein
VALIGKSLENYSRLIHRRLKESSRHYGFTFIAIRKKLQLIGGGSSGNNPNPNIIDKKSKIKLKPHETHWTIMKKYHEPLSEIHESPIGGGGVG